MNDSHPLYHYTAFNQPITSRLAFPELAVSSLKQSPAIQITIGSVASEGITRVIDSGYFFQKNENSYWINIPTIGRFLVQEGRQITVDPYMNVDEAALRIFILDTCFKELLAQQGYFILAGTAIKVANSAAVFITEPGCGKSTLATLFLEAGFSILTDNVCALYKGSVFPAYPTIHVGAETAMQTTLNHERLQPIRPNINKYPLALRHQFQDYPLPIQCIYFIEYHRSSQFEIEEIPIHKKSVMLARHTRHNIYGEFNTDIEYTLTNHNIREKPMLKIKCPRTKSNLKEMPSLLYDFFDRIKDQVQKQVDDNGTY